MPSAGDVLRGPDGIELRFARTAEDTGGELLEMEARYPGNGSLPPEHYHPRQAERFEVLEGQTRAIVGGRERRYAAGETFDVPAGTPHQMTADVPTRLRWQVRPALRTAEFFERVYGADPDELREPDAIAALLREFEDEIRLTGA